MNESHIEAQRWLRQAQADLAVVHTLHAAGHHAAACFYSQQAAEKALKAVVFAHGARVVLGHSVRELARQCETYDTTLGRYEQTIIDIVMKVRFQADADFNYNIVRALRRYEPAIDFQTAHDAGLHGLDDLVVLAKAVCEGRLLVSHDFRTMSSHFATFTTTRTSAGVILIAQDCPLRQAVDDLTLVWAASEAEEWVNRLDVLSF